MLANMLARYHAIYAAAQLFSPDMTTFLPWHRAAGKLPKVEHINTVLVQTQQRIHSTPTSNGPSIRLCHRSCEWTLL